ncbi:MAG: hypothetical protein JSR58_03560 [Verrucomicrobia bacterium]|nr:hypothetical protein [Verrucomicrobiota bacterium]
MKKIIPAFLSLLSLSLIEARETVEFVPSPPPEESEPWFTGPLLTPSAQVVPYGHVNFEPYIYWTQTRNKFNSHWHSFSIPHGNQLLSQNFIQSGIYNKLELDLTPQFAYNKKQGQHMWRVLDMPFGLAYQLYADENNRHVPKLKLRMQATAPIGKYDRLDPEKNGTDIGGTGSWNPQFGLVFSELFYIKGAHYLSTRVFVNYVIPTPVHVRGISAYGGTHKTRGTVYPGNQLVVAAAMEYSFTQNWVYAMDLLYVHSNKTRFSGKKGSPIAPGGPSSENFSVAPAIEYNWSSDIGIIAGPWIVFAGRNTEQFISWVAAVNFYF